MKCVNLKIKQKLVVGSQKNSNCFTVVMTKNFYKNWKNWEF